MRLPELPRATLAALTRCAALFGAALGVANCSSSPETDANVVVFAGYGGNYQDDIAKALLQPAADKLQLALRQDTNDALPAVRLQVQSGEPAWDIVQLGAAECARGEREGLFEPLDYSQIKTAGIDPTARGKTWISSNYYSVVLAWRSDKYPDPPKSWADFWNVKKYPGRRSLSILGNEMLEVALMADGVSKEKLYPLDVDRAIRSVEKIKPHVNVWWTSGAQSTQLIKDGEVDLIAIYSSRVVPLIENGSPVKFTYREGLLSPACFAIPKGAAHVAQAQKMIALMVSPELQSNIPKVLKYYGPANAMAATDDPRSNTAPANVAQQAHMSAQWWGQHGAEAEERYRAVVAAAR